MFTTATKGTNKVRRFHTFRSEQKRVHRSLRRAINNVKQAANDNTRLH